MTDGEAHRCRGPLLAQRGDQAPEARATGVAPGTRVDELVHDPLLVTHARTHPPPGFAR